MLEGTPGGVMRIKGTMWGDPVTENPDVENWGDVEDWEIYNLVQDAPVPHPIHIHETTFEILERRMADYDWDMGVIRGQRDDAALPRRTVAGRAAGGHADAPRLRGGCGDEFVCKPDFVPAVSRDG